MSPVKYWLIGVGVVVVLVVAILSFGTIPAGYLGVHTRFGSVVGTAQPGLYAVFPFVDGMTAVNTQTQIESLKEDAASQDLQTVTADIALNYHIDAASAVSIYKTIGYDNIVSKIVDPALQESIKSVTAQFNANDLIDKRENVRQGIETLVQNKLEPLGFKVDQLSIVNFNFSNQFNQAIEQKVTAQQNVLTSQQLLDKANIDAQKTIVEAKAQAEAIQIQAQAVQSQGGADYVKLQAIKQWDGHMPQVVGGNGNLLFSIPSATTPSASGQ